VDELSTTSGESPPLRGLRGVDHIGITVPNMEQATAFFVDVLGCKLLYEREPPGDDTPRDRLGVPAGTVSRAFAFCAVPTVRTSSSSNSTHPTSARSSRGRATSGYSTWQSTSTTWTPQRNTCAATE
jgi:catechol 2,3-dioxygenase-like lactoylglutathione lyase family enzyme